MCIKKINNFLRLIKQKIKYVYFYYDFFKKNLIKKGIFTKYYHYVIKIIINVTSKTTHSTSKNNFLNIIKLYLNNKQQNSSLKKLVLNIKFKTLNNQLLKYYYNLVIKNLNGFFKLPIAIHFYNAQFNTKWFVEKLTTKFFLSNIKYYNKISYNGCRKKKFKKKKWLNG